MILVNLDNGLETPVRALLDNGATDTFLLAETSRRAALNIKGQVRYTMNTFSGDATQNCNDPYVCMALKSSNGDYRTPPINCVIREKMIAGVTTLV